MIFYLCDETWIVISYMHNYYNNEIKIIGGKWKGRRIAVVDDTEVRPTTNFMRETLFNWLYITIADAVCLDCFAGSGALGIEALSRGANKVTFLEYNIICVTTLLKTLRSLHALSYSEVIYTDTLVWVKQLKRVYDVVFIDPPFKSNIIPELVWLLEKYNILRRKAWIYIEISNKQDALGNKFIPSYWILMCRKISKNVKYYLYARNF